MGLKDLSEVPTLMTGYGSVLDHASAKTFARAAFSLRQLGLTLSSEASLRQAVYDFQEWDIEKRGEPDYVEMPYRIDPQKPGIPFQRIMQGNDPRVTAMVNALLAGLPLAHHGLRRADAKRSFRAPNSRGANPRTMTFTLADAASNLAPLPSHDLTGQASNQIRIPIGDLADIAREFDEMDRDDPTRPQRSWEKRLRTDAGPTVELLEPASDRSGLVPASEIVLEGLKHFIGLPGTGKTTIIVLILSWLHRRKLKAVVLLPSIEVSFNLMTELSRYGVKAGLLMGQSPETRINHAQKLAERIASIDDSRGFARSVPFAEMMGLNCALGGFDTDETTESPFPHLDPPCRDVKQKRLSKKGQEIGDPSSHLCPVAGWCGRMRASRELADRGIWLGHVLSLDTRIPPHFVEEHVRYLEAVAMTADVVIADEADGIQAALDQKAVSVIDITGSKSSYEMRLIEDLFAPIAGGNNDLTAANVTDYSQKASRFIELNRSLTNQLQIDHRSNSDAFLADYGDAFVTGNRVAFDLFGTDLTGLPPDKRVAAEVRFNGVAEFWDACVRDALYRSATVDGVDDVRDFDIGRAASAIGKSREEVEAAYRVLVETLRDWLSSETTVLKGEAIGRARVIMFALIPPREELDEPRRVALFTFLVHVTSVVMQFLALLPAQHAMVAEGVHNSPVFQQGISADYRRLVPEALIGRLSGVRFNFESDGQRTRLSVQYMTFDGAPRVLLYRLHELLRHDGQAKGPAVLLASATSFLEKSPTFHIPCGPDYVLRRAEAEDGWRDSTYIFQPIPNPEDQKRMLRFSGAPFAMRDRILKQMLEHYLQGDDPKIQSLTRDFAPGRKVGFVVNGYDQVRMLKEHAMLIRKDLGQRIVAVVSKIPEGASGDYITTAQVERLGQRDDWDAVIFPMKALSRGVNIVFGGDLFDDNDDLKGKAAIGTVIFLTRPHPSVESYDFVAGLVGAESLAFEKREFAPNTPLSSMTNEWKSARSSALRTVRRLLRHSVRASQLGEDLLERFVADIMIDVLQTIGRSMRNGCKARVIFVDAAWAQRSCDPKSDQPETSSTSFLAAMRTILLRCIQSPEPVERQVYEALYLPFLEPLRRCEGVRFEHVSDDD
jgi:hypothetical protein